MSMFGFYFGTNEPSHLRTAFPRSLIISLYRSASMPDEEDDIGKDDFGTITTAIEALTVRLNEIRLGLEDRDPSRKRGRDDATDKALEEVIACMSKYSGHLVSLECNVH